MKGNEPDVATELLSIPKEWPQAEALFRAQLVAPLLDPLSEPEERTAWRRWVTTRPHTLPNGQTRRVSERTLRRWVAQARAVGYEGLKAAVRRDRGRLRKLRPEWIERAVALKREEPRRSVPHILRMLQAEFGDGVQVNPGTLWRHLAREGLGGRAPLPKAGLRRWESRGVGEIWQADVKYGPHLPDPQNPQRVRQTYLVAFLDDYSRYICHGEFFFAEDVYALEVCFQKALLRCGKPARVYVDRGLIFQSRVFRTACAALGIRHISATAYRPEGKGKIERFFRTVDEELLLEWRHNPGNDLQSLNQLWWAWLEEVYHTRVHSETDQSPLVRFTQAQCPRLDPETVHDAFLWRASRRVDRTGRLRLEGNVYQTMPGLEGRQVEVRFHPLDLRRLRVYCEGRRCEDAVAVELLQRTSPRVDSSHLTQQGSAEPASPSHYLFQLLERHRQHKRRVLSPLQLAATEGGEDYV